MTPAFYQLQPFARSLSSLSGAANRSDGGAPSHFRPTTLDNSQHQRLTGTALGRRLVMYRSTLGVRVGR